MIADQDLFVYKISKVLKVIDGDTFDALIDLGFNVSIKVRVRMYGINTPECRTRNKEEKIKGLAAKKRLSELCEGSLIIKSHGIGKYGRVLGEVYNQESSLGDMLIQEGHAKEYYGGRR